MQQIADWLKKLGMAEYTDRFVLGQEKTADLTGAGWRIDRNQTCNAFNRPRRRLCFDHKYVH